VDEPVKRSERFVACEVGVLILCLGIQAGVSGIASIPGLLSPVRQNRLTASLAAQTAVSLPHAGQQWQNRRQARRQQEDIPPRCLTLHSSLAETASCGDGHFGPPLDTGALRAGGRSPPTLF
jgi:hypothetical protein